MHLCLNMWQSLAGAGVVVFNNVIHEIRSSLWHSTPSDATSWAYWARDLPISARWNSLLLPPVLGGLAVGLLRKVSGGFDNPPDEQQQQQQQLSQTTSTSTTAASSSTQKPQNNSRAAATSRASAARTQESSASASVPSISTPDTDVETVSRLSSSQEASTSHSSTLWSLPLVTSGSQSLKQRLLRVIRPLLKATAAAITLGTGNSLGPAGPSVEIGRAAARGLGNVLKSKQRRLLSLVAAGSGAGETCFKFVMQCMQMLLFTFTAHPGLHALQPYYSSTAWNLYVKVLLLHHRVGVMAACTQLQACTPHQKVLLLHALHLLHHPRVRLYTHQRSTIKRSTHSISNPSTPTSLCAGVAAGFNAPISGVFFAVETVLQAQGSDLRRNSADTTPGLTIAMVLLASVLAAIVSQAGLGQAPAVRVPDYQLQSILELPLILGFGACCGAVSASFAYSNQVSSASALTVL